MDRSFSHTLTPFAAALAAATVLALALLLAAFAPTALAAANPSSTAQPNASCESSTTEPTGFSTTGFAQAQTVYAGAGKSTDQPSNSHAVSQYDVACFQLSSRP